MNANKGFTLLELMIVLAILGIALTSAMDTLGTTTSNTRVYEASAKIADIVKSAKMEAVKLNQPVEVSITSSAITAKTVSGGYTRTLNLSDKVSVSSGSFSFTSLGAVVDESSHTINITQSGQSCSLDVKCQRLMVSAAGFIKLCDPMMEDQNATTYCIQ